MPKGISEKLKGERKAIANYVDNGHTRDETAQHFGCSICRVDHACREFSVSSRRYLNHRQLFGVLHLLMTTDLPMTYVADKKRVTLAQVQNVYRDAKQAGFDLYRPRGRPSNKRLERLNDQENKHKRTK